MEDLKFKKNENFNLGLELELQIVDKTTYKLKRVRQEIIDNLPDKFREFIKKEYFQSMIEIVSPVASSIEELLDFYTEIFSALKITASKCNAKLLSLGTHPFAKLTDALPTEDKRYLRLQNELQMVLNRFLIYGMHIHISVPDETASVNVHNHVLNFMPLFLAFSTSSPFFEGHFTGMHSYRSLIFENLPRGGVPEYIDKYDDFISSYKFLYQNNYINGFNELWWDVRIRPDYGTVELRICDSINDLNRIKGIVTLYLLLVKSLYNVKATKLPFVFYTQNKWNALRYSTTGSFIDIDSGANLPIKSKLEQLINYFSNNLTDNEFRAINYLLQNEPISFHLIKEFQKTGLVNEIVKIGEI